METAFDWIASASGWTLRNSLEASVLIVLVAAISLIWRERLSSGFRAALWIAVGVRLLLPFAPESGLSVFNFIPGEAPEPELAAGATAEFVAPIVAASVSDSQPLAAASKPAAIGLGASAMLAFAWLAGALAILGFTLIRQIQTMRRIRRLPEVEHSRIRKLLRRCVKETGVKRQPRIVEAPDNASVAVFGFLRPSHVIIPRGLAERYTESEIRGIFLHELAHIRRGDLLWNWLTLAVQALHWFNPLVWWAGRRFLAERELICDRFALRRLPKSERRDYGLALLKMLEFGATPAPAPNPALLPFFSQKSELKHRLTMIKKTHSISPIVQALAAVVAIAACAMTFTSALADEREGSTRRSAESEGERGSTRDGERGSTRDGEREGDTRRSAESEGERGSSRDAEREGDSRRSAERRGDSRREGDREGEGRGIRGDGEGDRPAARDGELQVRVYERGVVIGDKEIPLVNLRRALEEHPVKSAVLTADTNVPFQSVATVMNALRDSGVNDVRFQSLGAEREGGVREMRRDGEGGGSREGARDGDGERRTGPRDGEGAPAREGARDGDGERRRTGPRDGEGAPAREGARDGEGGRSPEGARDGEGARRTGPRDGEGGTSREGARDGEGDPSRDGDSAGALDDRHLSQLTRIYRAYDKNGDKKITFEEWVAMKNYTLSDDQRAREKGWFDQADANENETLTLGEWIDWKASQGGNR